MHAPPSLPVLSPNDREQFWPPLSFTEWQATAETLHMWTQIVGKIRLALTPWINHSWHVTLYLTARGLTTSPIPHGFHCFEIRFDFIRSSPGVFYSSRPSARSSVTARPLNAAFPLSVST